MSPSEANQQVVVLNRYRFNPCNYDWNQLLDRMVFNPNASFYSFWIYYLSIVSLIQSFLYTHFMAFRLDDEYRLDWFLLVGFCELSFLLGIIIETFKAYDSDA